MDTEGRQRAISQTLPCFLQRPHWVTPYQFSSCSNHESLSSADTVAGSRCYTQPRLAAMSMLRKATGRGLLHSRRAKWAVPLGLCTRAGSKTLTPRTAKHSEPVHSAAKHNTTAHIPEHGRNERSSVHLQQARRPRFQENFSRPPSALQSAVLVNTLCDWDGAAPAHAQPVSARR